MNLISLAGFNTTEYDFWWFDGGLLFGPPYIVHE